MSVWRVLKAIKSSIHIRKLYTVYSKKKKGIVKKFALKYSKNLRVEQGGNLG